MSEILYWLRTHPVLVASAVEAVLLVLVAFHVDLSEEQMAAIVTLVTVLTGVATQRKTNSRYFVNTELRDAEQAIKAAKGDGLV